MIAIRKREDIWGVDPSATGLVRPTGVTGASISMGSGRGGLTGASISRGFGRGGLASTDLTVFARLLKCRSRGGENASIHCEVEMKYSSFLAGATSSIRNGMM